VAIGIYIAALRSGMQALYWALAALLTGPLLLPLFSSHKRLQLCRAHGSGGQVFKP
jgi:hypothetical protein